MAFGGLSSVELSELNSQNAEDDLEKLFLHTVEAGVKDAASGTDEVVDLRDWGGLLVGKFLDVVKYRDVPKLKTTPQPQASEQQPRNVRPVRRLKLHRRSSNPITI